MPVTPNPSRRKVLLIIVFSAILSIIFVTTFRNQSSPNPRFQWTPDVDSTPRLQPSDPISETTLTGHAIAPKLGNETIKAELGRAAWKLFHTIMARFPDAPTADEKSALKSYIHLFQRLYPCGECAEHFREILDKYPPQVSTRSAAAAWACHVHNEVNRSLGKGVFDCANIGEFYDCGCAEEEKVGMDDAGARKEVEAGRERDVGHERVHRRPHLKAEG
jgi:FAD-linked sulfhydryl oxidase